ncbi:MAG: pyruvate dehydrogenase (acetyl-transferring), homodimeric type [Candidatus Parabeggiatoa sp. nov. 3]|nr:MAG: pyruvate dehydrogenase (acetyl-transferring), homodimeric type [Gammaproteobacteria bacterium]RKZ67469.1 MAG: pyruvate dehydrogenase (acetyl-transferring), homodimeric type [Gammaproteobacteria bacterium]RKZ83506.1 MAG: pyruvate dehydrogenase (acetyl-transferring), homodimeric type [Gammaproteobacteria bacterium]HEW97520.1 pyruvate dehydrogenase (acetyl-transferring), homodimeric type [Beggiatoa sp.]
MAEHTDIDPQETQEWLDALESVLAQDGPERAHFLLDQLIDKARRSGAHIPHSANTAYVNTIPYNQEVPTPGDPEIEWKIRSLIRWNAMAMVVQANRQSAELGGHIATFASIATLYDVGFNHFFRAKSAHHGGDLVYFQGHSAPGIYARAFLEGRITEEQMLNFRQEVGGKGLSSYPHPWLMPDFWQFPTVSMGLGPIQGIYQARFMKYLHDRGIVNTAERKVWIFAGDGEMDEPEALGAISLAAREKLDNLVFVVNCNLQRLDGPVRGNGKIIQELEGDFRGAGWNVIKVIWGSYWDSLFAMDTKGLLLKRMEECVDGEYQNYKAKGGAYTREHFFGKYPELKAMVAKMTDEDIWRLNRGGHDPHKVYAAYAAAAKHKGQPTVIIAKSVKGYGMGDAGEGQNITHQQKKMGTDDIRKFRDRFNLPISDEQLPDVPFYKPPEDSPEMKYLHERRQALGGYLPSRSKTATPIDVPDISLFDAMLKGSGDREMSTTMAFVRMLSTLTRDKKMGKHVVPIVPDEARTFGMEGLFRQLGIYSSQGQLYEPQDADQVMYYREDQKGQIIEEGINEAGAMSSWIAAATAYSNHGVNMVPFYIFYSMFGFQRIGDLAWAAGDLRARGFLIGGTAGRTTLSGEGLQHQDGHGVMLASNIPNCVVYDPTFAYEMAVIIHNGLSRMYKDQENIFYYITAMNENYTHPAMPEGVEESILKGMYLFKESATPGPKVQLLGSGAILREVIAASVLLAQDFGVSANIWSVTSFTELHRQGVDVLRWNMLHPEEEQRQCYVKESLKDCKGPVVAATDYVKSYPNQIRSCIPHPHYYVLGTDGFGRSDSRKQLRKFFEVDRYYITVAALKGLADTGEISASQVTEALRKYEIDSETPNPITV